MSKKQQLVGSIRYGGPNTWFTRPFFRDGLGWGMSRRGCTRWIFGDSTEICDAVTFNPSVPLIVGKHCILRSIQFMPSGAGLFQIRDWVTQTDRFTVFVNRFTPLSLHFGPNGVDIGTSPYVIINDQNIHSILTYDIE